MPTRAKAVKIALWYLGVSVVWIFVTGWLLHHAVTDAARAAWWENVKGWVFVGATAVVLGVALDRYFRAIRRFASQWQQEEARLRLIGDNLPEGYVFQYTRDAGGQPRFSYISAGVKAVHGVSPAEVLQDAGCLFRQLAPEDVQAHAAAEAASVHDLSNFNMDMRMTARDGSLRLVRVSVHPRRNEDGQVVWNGLVLDVTARRQAEEALARSGQNYREIFNATHEAIFLHDAATGEVLDVNETMLRIYGYDSKAAFFKDRGQALFNAGTPFTREEARRRVRLAVEQGPQVFEWLARNRNGETFWVEVSLRSSQIGGQGRVLGVVRDFSLRKAHEQEIGRLTRLYATLSQVNQTIVRCQTRADLFNGICRVMIEFGKFQAVRIGECQEGAGGLATLAQRNCDPARPGILPAGGCGVTADMLGTGRPAICNDFRADARVGGCRECLQSLGVCSCAAFPLYLQGAVWGAFSACTSEADFFQAEEVRLLEEIASDISYALDRLRTQELRQAAEAALHANRAKLTAALASMTDAMVITDVAGRFIDFNQAFATFHRFKSKADCAKTHAEYPDILEIRRVDGELLSKEQWLVPRALRGETGTSVEYTLRRKDTGETWAGSYSFAPIRDGAGTILGAVMVCRDITERKLAEEKIRELNRTLDQRVQERTAELRASNEELDAFAYAVSHDLRAPLRAMSGFSQALQEDFASQLPPEAREYLDHIQSGSRQMGELIDGLLRLSRSLRGELQRDTVDLSALAGRLLGEWQRAEPQRAVAWTVAPDLVVKGDARLLEVVFGNLLGNAWKYTSHTPQATIRVTGQADGGAWIINVADNGAGFDMKHAAKLFQPFQRLHREDEFPGLGIGLATVQRILRRHGGTIQAVGAPGAGATFTVSLPQFKPHEQPQ